MTIAFGNLDGDELWRFIVSEVEKEVKSLDLALRSKAQTSSLEEVRYLQGQRKALAEWLMGLPNRGFSAPTTMQALRSTRSA